VWGTNGVALWDDHHHVPLTQHETS